MVFISFLTPTNLPKTIGNHSGNFDFLTFLILEISLFSRFFGFTVRLSEPLLNQNLLQILKAHKKLRRFHSEIPKKDVIEALW